MSTNNILSKAQDIVYGKTQQEERKYGPFGENMERCAKIASVMSNKELTAEDCFNVMIAQKLVRQSYHHKEDNLVDACGYIAGLNDYKNDKVNTTTSEQASDQPTDRKNQAT